VYPGDRPRLIVQRDAAEQITPYPPGAGAICPRNRITPSVSTAAPQRVRMRRRCPLGPSVRPSAFTATDIWAPGSEPRMCSDAELGPSSWCLGPTGMFHHLPVRVRTCRGTGDQEACWAERDFGARSSSARPSGHPDLVPVCGPSLPAFPEPVSWTRRNPLLSPTFQYPGVTVSRGPTRAELLGRGIPEVGVSNSPCGLIHAETR